MPKTKLPPLTFADLVDKNDNPLSPGAEVQYAMGSKLREGQCVVPKWVVPKAKPKKKGHAEDEEDIDLEFDEVLDDDDDEREIDMTSLKPGVLIYNDDAPNRKTVIRACEDVCLLVS